ncbi:hypothetical protein B5X24_HaOG206794 [Helicoverpa armigera]|uniref:Uncharacterized protein n=1 Tax=Helicoverpa armigera TaxID=29058 RepID=A0A2W1BTG6_HELAM|nr:hypothetical protein B5X24_HaOG206794 [Helicoverpa armigera]
MQITCALKNLQRLLYTPYDIFHLYPSHKRNVKLERKDGFGVESSRRRVCVPRTSSGRCRRIARASVYLTVRSNPFRSEFSCRAVDSYASPGRTVGSRAGAAVGDGPRRGQVLVSGDGGLCLRAPTEPSHGMLFARGDRGAPHSRAQGDYSAATC